MKCRLFAAAVLALFVTYSFGESAMASDALESLTGTWVVVDPERKSFPFRCADSSSAPYIVIINGDKITITWRNKIICDTVFRLDDSELKNTKKRENWQAYVESHQYELFGHFERIKLLDGELVGFIFVADRGYIKLAFTKRP